ncbi:MAG: purine-nucleoside phosphorylase [Bdellovibrionaceae bacterium]|jgi:purine-nucleoside phosphorylase|nr:purine-nucleoside phosphorylase [Pseudobdellovibrionaceae bacterium]
MLTKDSIQTYENFLHSVGLNQAPHFHVVLGSGFGEALRFLSATSWQLVGEIPFTALPGLKPSGVQDHKGSYQVYRHVSQGWTIQFQLGRIHGYEGHTPQQVVSPVMLPRQAGVKNFILTNAAGGLLREQQPGGAMVISDHVNLTGLNPLAGDNPVDVWGRPLGPRFPDLGNLYHLSWRQKLKQQLEAQNLNVTEGVYLGLLGPSFETHAEVKLFASWGMGAVGMSTVWEAIALRHSGATLAGVSLISNLGAGLSPQALDHEAIVATCRSSAGQIVKAIVNTIEHLLQ